MPTAWRLVKTRYAASAFDGEGARRHGARWNSAGTRVAYAAGTASLAILETLVHLQSSRVLASYSLIAVEIPARVIEVLDRARLPHDWKRSPPPPAVQAIGDAWVRAGSSAVLRVPSVVVDSESIYLVNPAHRDFGRLAVRPPEPFGFDARLLATRRPDA